MPIFCQGCSTPLKQQDSKNEMPFITNSFKFFIALICLDISVFIKVWILDWNDVKFVVKVLKKKGKKKGREKNKQTNKTTILQMGNYVKLLNSCQKWHPDCGMCSTSWEECPTFALIRHNIWDTMAKQFWQMGQYR